MSTQWYTLRRGGMALVASAALLLALILWSFALTANAAPPVLYVLLNLLAYVLLLAGLPAIYALLPGAGRVAQIGFLSLALGTATSIIVLLLVIFNVKSLPGIVDWFYYITSTIGYLIVGWATTGRPLSLSSFRTPRADQPRVLAPIFPTWVGWTMFATGVASIVLGPGYSALVLTFALGGYGITILRATQPSAAGQTDEASIEPLG